MVIDTPIMNMTPELRAEVLAKALAVKKAKHEAWKETAHTLKTDFADKAYWRKLASKYKVRFPSDYVPGSEFKAARKAMRKAGVSPEQIREVFGGDVKAIHRDNPTWPLFAIIGLILEIAESK